MTERKACPDAKWEQLTTEELDQTLQTELRKEHPDETVVLPILHTLEERERDILTEEVRKTCIDPVLLSKQNTFPARRRSAKGWIAGAAALVAAACLAVVILPKAAGAESFLDVLYRWTASVFEFIDPDREEQKPAEDPKTVVEHPGLQRLSAEMQQLGVTAEVVPTWLPDGYVLTEIKRMQFPAGYKLFAYFEADESIIIFSYWIMLKEIPTVEKEAEMEVFEFHRVKHMLLSNRDGWSVTWVNANVKGLINTDLDKDTVCKMIKSIYRSELN